MPLFDFTQPFEPWIPIGDVIMGGRSKNTFESLPEGCALFSGILSPGEEGGFASVRSPRVELDLGAESGIELELCGDGKRYKLALRSEGPFDGVQFQAPLAPPAGAWTHVRIPFEEFRPVFRGRALDGKDPLDASALRSVGFIIAERQTGSFSLKIRTIAAYR